MSDFVLIVVGLSFLLWVMALIFIFIVFQKMYKENQHFKSEIEATKHKINQRYGGKDV
ncbi:hypothetical protein [Moraxella sp. ZY210820]|uniref:hypothetical protein n=1 Tax=unclassified Moraxella TaxID=2685852 RepID=UPI0027320DA6|nr:hypothetical protein [Moraxella sp. ZY210820]WLF83782.1 hypothetical protein LU301_11140 [Moraxella sp. ZY210820]